MAKSKEAKVSSSAVRQSIKKKDGLKSTGNEDETEGKAQVCTH